MTSPLFRIIIFAHVPLNIIVAQRNRQLRFKREKNLIYIPILIAWSMRKNVNIKNTENVQTRTSVHWHLTLIYTPLWKPCICTPKVILTFSFSTKDQRLSSIIVSASGATKCLHRSQFWIVQDILLSEPLLRKYWDLISWIYILRSRKKPSFAKTDRQFCVNS